MPSFVEADQSVHGPSRVQTVIQSQPENGAQSVASNLGAAEREPPYANMDARYINRNGSKSARAITH